MQHLTARMLMLSMVGIAINCHASPIFTVSPTISGPQQLLQGQIGTMVYQVTNNSNKTLPNIGLIGLPAGVTVVPSAGVDYCANPFNLLPNSSCLVKIKIDSAIAQSGVSGGPQVCFSSDRPVYCSQPLAQDQLAIQVLRHPIPQTCKENIANFTDELSNQLDTTTVVTGWGPETPIYALSPTNPDLRNCPVSGGIVWQQQRVLAAADFWIKQKLNYCHHYAPDWVSPVAVRGAGKEDAGYCNPAVDISPNTVYFNQAVRWNYSGTGSETLANWQNNNYMWRGMDCSNYTAFLYNFALGKKYTGDVGFQAGQRSDGSQTELSPNRQSGGDVLDNPRASGGEDALVCADNTMEHNHTCAGHGGYISVFNDHAPPNNYDANAVTDAILEKLHPGDLLYIAASLTDGMHGSKVTHVVLWTGKKIGNGANDIPASRIAPNSLCPHNWQPQLGGWVITDSHYQGADYRMLTQCFYRSNIWGVRRPIR